MPDTNPYTPGRNALREEIERLRALHDALQRQEQDWEANHEQPGNEPKNAGIAGFARVRTTIAGPRPAVNGDAPSWAEEIRSILGDGKPRLISEIVADLEARGRRFGPKTNRADLVRSTLHRTKDKQKWEAFGAPLRWRLPASQRKGEA